MKTRYDKLARIRQRQTLQAELALARAVRSANTVRDAIAETEARLASETHEADSADLWAVVDLNRARQLMDLAAQKTELSCADSLVEDKRETLAQSRQRSDSMTTLKERAAARMRRDSARREQGILDEAALRLWFEGVS